MFKLNMGNTPSSISEEDYRELGRKTEVILKGKVTRAGHLQYFFYFFNDKNDNFCIFYQVNLTEGRLFK